MRGKKAPRAAALKGRESAAAATKGARSGRGSPAGTGRKPAAAAVSTGGASPQPDEGPHELPARYDETRVVLTVVDPHLVNVRWDLNARHLSRVKRGSARGGRTSFPVVRFHEVIEGPSHAGREVERFDVEIDLGPGNWYVPLWSADRTYFVELGFKTTGGDFYPLARSNTAVVPPSGPAEKEALHLALVTEAQGTVDAVEIAPFQTLHPPPQIGPDVRERPRGPDAPTFTGPAALKSVPPSPTRGTRRPARDRAIGIEVLWALPEEAEYPSAGAQLTAPERTDAFDLAARAERLFAPGISS